MHRLNEIASKLTPAQLKEVEDFAESLIRGKTAAPDPVNGAGNKINVEALLGLCKGMGGDLSDDELIREAWDSVVDEAENAP